MIGWKYIHQMRGRKMIQILKESGGTGSGRQKSILRRLLILAAAVFLFEILIGNYSSVRSLFYRKTDLTDRMKLTWGGDGEAE